MGAVDWPCDCNLIQLLESFGPITSSPWSIDKYAKCKSPDNLNGSIIMEQFRGNNDTLKYFICDVKLNCPGGCKCYYQPYPVNETVINCTETDMTKLPSIVPHYTNLALNFSNICIQYLSS